MPWLSLSADCGNICQWHSLYCMHTFQSAQSISCPQKAGQSLPLTHNATLAFLFSCSVVIRGWEIFRETFLNLQPQKGTLNSLKVTISVGGMAVKTLCGILTPPKLRRERVWEIRNGNKLFTQGCHHKKGKKLVMERGYPASQETSSTVTWTVTSPAVFTLKQCFLLQHRRWASY